MKITKYEHACLDITDEDSRLVIDPGRFSPSLKQLDGIDIVVITHIHRDHCDEATVQKITQLNPSVQIFTTQETAKHLNLTQVKTPEIGKPYLVSGFTLEFFGGQHEFYSEFQNVAVLINGAVFHPGDSYTTPNKPIKMLGAPASAPWLRVRDAIEYMQACKPDVAFPIHNALLSEVGETVHYPLFQNAAQEIGIEWKVLKPGESIEI